MKTLHGLFLFALSIAACGSPEKKPAEAPHDAPKPVLPPSMTGGGTAPKDTPAPAGTSDDVARGTKAIQAGDLKGAMASFEAALKKNPKDADAIYYVGLLAEKAGDTAGAERSYKDALKIRPDFDDAALNLGAMYVDAKRYDEAIAAMRPLIAKHPADPALHQNLAVALAGKGDQAGSAKSFEEAVRLSPNDAMVLITYAHALAEWKQNDAAIAKLKAAVPLAGHDVGLLASIAVELLQIRAVPECISTLDKAINLRDAAELRDYRARCKLAAKDKAGALADLQAAVAKEPSYAPAHFWVGDRLGADGKWKEAQAEYETYLRLAPSGPFAKQAADHLKFVKDRIANPGKK